MSFVNSEDAGDSLDVAKYNFVDYQPISGFSESRFVSADENNVRIGDESQQTIQYNWLSSSPSGSIDDLRDNGSVQVSVVGPHQVYTPIISYHDDGRGKYHSSYDCALLNSITNEYQSTTCSGELSTNEQILADHLQVLRRQQPSDQRTLHHPFVRIVKRRTTANKKERRRTQSINNAYADLRDCINVPADTKLSKIKTLRLALSYITYLTGILGTTDNSIASYQIESIAEQCGQLPSSDGRSHFTRSKSSPIKKDPVRDEHAEQKQDQTIMESRQQRDQSKASKGRTGWPQHLWAMELKQHGHN